MIFKQITAILADFISESKQTCKPHAEIKSFLFCKDYFRAKIAQTAHKSREGKLEKETERKKGKRERSLEHKAERTSDSLIQRVCGMKFYRNIYSNKFYLTEKLCEHFSFVKRPLFFLLGKMPEKK